MSGEQGTLLGRFCIDVGVINCIIGISILSRGKVILFVEP